MDPNDYYNQIGQAPQKKFFDNLGGYFIEFFETLIIFGAIFAALYLFVAQFHKVSGNSMVPTLQNGDYLITEKVSYKFRDPTRGEIIVLKNPKDESQDFIKRVIALPGDTLEISNNKIFLNGRLLEEPYLPTGAPTKGGAFVVNDSPVKAGNNQYFVIGDNREHSSDSRTWGPIIKEEIVGRAIFRYFPFQNISLLTNK